MGLAHLKFALGCIVVGIAATGCAAPGPATASANGTLYADIGGDKGLDRIVDEAVTIYVTDPRIRDDFDNINLDRLRVRLKSQLCALADGPCQYTGRSMEASHKALGIDQARFNAVAEGMQTAMERAGVPYRTQNRMMARLAPMQRAIVTK